MNGSNQSFSKANVLTKTATWLPEAAQSKKVRIGNRAHRISKDTNLYLHEVKLNQTTLSVDSA